MSDAESTGAAAKMLQPAAAGPTANDDVPPTTGDDCATAAPAAVTTAPTGPSIAALMSRRFRGFLPVVVDVETGGFHSSTDALLEIAAVLIEMEPDGTLRRGATHNFH